MFDDIVRHRLERDLGHDPDDARISVRAGDLRALLEHALGRRTDDVAMTHREAEDAKTRRGAGADA
jgi:hypothetical protein